MLLQKVLKSRKAKTTQETADKMMETTEPSEHKALGRQAKGFNRAKWDQRSSFAIHDDCFARR